MKQSNKLQNSQYNDIFVNKIKFPACLILFPNFFFAFPEKKKVTRRFPYFELIQRSFYQIIRTTWKKIDLSKGYCRNLERKLVVAMHFPRYTGKYHWISNTNACVSICLKKKERIICFTDFLWIFLYMYRKHKNKHL